MKTNPELWHRIDAFSADDGDAAFPFSARLAHDNGWSRTFAERVVTEYKRFLYLACISPTAVTPSEEVDQAWHLHLTYSRSYWLDLCPNVLRRDLHHGPTKGGEQETLRYRDQYRDTLKLYRTEFGEDAPSQIWPGLNDRFAGAATSHLVDRARNFVIPKVHVAAAVSVLAALGVAQLLLMANPQVHGARWHAQADLSEPLFNTPHPIVSILLAILAIFAVVVWYLAKRDAQRKRRRKPGNNSGPFSSGGCGSSNDSGSGASGCGGGCGS